MILGVNYNQCMYRLHHLLKYHYIDLFLTTVFKVYIYCFLSLLGCHLESDGPIDSAVATAISIVSLNVKNCDNNQGNAVCKTYNLFGRFRDAPKQYNIPIRCGLIMLNLMVHFENKPIMSSVLEVETQ
jgi:hypothetical protein